MAKKIDTEHGPKYVMDWDNIPKEHLGIVFENNVLEAIHFVVHNQVRLEHRHSLDGPWVDEWDDGYGLARFIKFHVSKGFQKSEPAHVSDYLRWWRIKQPNTQDIINAVKW